MKTYSIFQRGRLVAALDVPPRWVRGGYASAVLVAGELPAVSLEVRAAAFWLRSVRRRTDLRVTLHRGPVPSPQYHRRGWVACAEECGRYVPPQQTWCDPCAERLYDVCAPYWSDVHMTTYRWRDECQAAPPAWQEVR